MAAGLREYDDLVDAAGRVVAVIPAYNEARFIAGVVLMALQYTPHVIVVDDGSTDGTALQAQLAGAEVVNMPQNGGKGKALNAGFARAWSHHPNVVVVLDGDAQHDASEILHVARPVLRGQADIVVGSRFLESTTKDAIPRWRQLGQRALTRVTNSGSGLAITDSQSGFRAFSPEAVRSLQFRSGGLAVESEMQFLIERSSFQVMEVPISVTYLDGNKRNPVVQGLEVLEAIFSIVARRRPLILVVVPGTALTTIGVLLGLMVIHAVQAGEDVPVGEAVLGSFLILTGLMMGQVGVILYSFGRFTGDIRQEVQSTVMQQSTS